MNERWEGVEVAVGVHALTLTYSLTNQSLVVGRLIIEKLWFTQMTWDQRYVFEALYAVKSLSQSICIIIVSSWLTVWLYCLHVYMMQSMEVYHVLQGDSV